MNTWCHEKDKMNDRTLKLTWLILSCIIVVSTILIGGYTRLSSAGLSIVEWRPVTGMIPPISSQDWQDELSKYQTSPEYQQINLGISINEFKEIYWIEYVHRMVARLVGLVFALPFFVFLYYKILTRQEKCISSLILCLILLQGFLGWYMVSSGLDKIPFVSHFRLAIHLITAIFIYCLMFVLICRNLPVKVLYNVDNMKFRIYKIMLYFLLFAIIVQIFIGGLVAGLDAGYVYNTFPRMAGRLIPPQIYSFSLGHFSSPLHIQFLHRFTGYLISIIALLSWLYSLILFRKAPKVIFYISLILFSIICQILLGILTLIYIVPVPLALLHQIFPIGIISLCIWNINLQQ